MYAVTQKVCRVRTKEKPGWKGWGALMHTGRVAVKEPKVGSKE